jgi:hypothetical protein
MEDEEVGGKLTLRWIPVKQVQRMGGSVLV